MPKDLVGKGELKQDEYNEEEDYDEEEDDGVDLFGSNQDKDSQLNFDGMEEAEDAVEAEDEEADDLENDVFAAARENKEMERDLGESDDGAEVKDKKASKKFANQDMVDKIEKIESGMLEGKSW